MGPVRSPRRVTASGAEPSGRTGPGESNPSSPHAIVQPNMQTSLARRQRHRRTGAARRPRGGGAARRVAIAIPVFLFVTLLAVGLVVFVGAVTAYAYYSQGLENPKALLVQPRLRGADDRLRPDRQDRAGPARRAPPGAGQVRGDPRRAARRDDVHRGQGLLGERRLRLRRLRRRLGRHAQRPPARRVDDHPAARPGAAPAAVARSRARSTSGRSRRSSSRSA